MPKITKGEIVKMALATVGVAGIVVTGALCPGILHAIAPLVRKRYPYEGVRQAIHRLDKRGCIIMRQTANGWRLNLTKRGKAELSAYELGGKTIKKPRRWDKKWRLLIFDIPETKKTIRNRIRNSLVAFGFYRLQNSVWVFPYECQEILDLLRAGHGVWSEALYIRAEFIAQDKWLKKHFHLE